MTLLSQFSCVKFKVFQVNSVQLSFRLDVNNGTDKVFYIRKKQPASLSQTGLQTQIQTSMEGLVTHVHLLPGFWPTGSRPLAFTHSTSNPSAHTVSHSNKIKRRASRPEMLRGERSDSNSLTEAANRRWGRGGRSSYPLRSLKSMQPKENQSALLSYAVPFWRTSGAM